MLNCVDGAVQCQGAVVSSTEVCDGDDNDCDGDTDEGLTVRCYRDNDGDGFAAAGASYRDRCACRSNETTLHPTSTSNTDCNDGSSGAGINPDVEEITGDPIDQDCDGRELCWQDYDRDGYRDPLTTRLVIGTGCTSSQLAAPTSAPTEGDDPATWCDRNPDVHRDVTTYSSTPIPGVTDFSRDYDWNCNGREFKRYRSAATCYDNAGTASCGGSAGWATSAPPCGLSAPWVNCHGLGCDTFTTRTQRCR